MKEGAAPRRLPSRAIVALLLLPSAIALQMLSARLPSAVEALYSRRVYPPLVTALAWLCSRLSFPLAELGLAVLGAGIVCGLAWLGRALLLGRGQRLRILWRTSVSVLFVAGVSYLAFLLVWGLNYQRLTFAQVAGLPVRPSDQRELAALCADLVDSANLLREGLPEDARGAMRLVDGSAAALARTASAVPALRERYPWLPRPEIRPRAAWTSPWLARMGIGGFFFPLTAEPLVNVDVPETELPFCACHEVAHELGFAREGEANYVGYLLCRLHPDADFRYSGTYMAASHALAALAAVDRTEARALASRRSSAVKRDAAAFAAWLARYNGPAMKAAQRVNDAYLRSQGQEGVRSYGRMVDLLLAERRTRTN